MVRPRSAADAAALMRPKHGRNLGAISMMIVGGDEDRNNALDRWADEGPPITRLGVIWTLAAVGLLGLLVAANILKG